MVYTSTGPPTEYKMSVTLFVSRFLMVMTGEKENVRPFMLQHLQEEMEDVELYRWDPIRAFHAVWIKQGSRAELLAPMR